MSAPNVFEMIDLLAKNFDAAEAELPPEERDKVQQRLWSVPQREAAEWIATVIVPLMPADVVTKLQSGEVSIADAADSWLYISKAM